MRDPRVIRHAIVQFKPRKGLRAQNLAHIREILLTLRAQDDWPDVLVLPEASLSGYFLQGGVRELAVDAQTLFAELAELHKEVFRDPLDIVIGFFVIVSIVI